MLQYETQRASSKLLTAPATYDALTPNVFNLNFYQLNRADGTNMVNNLQLTVDDQIMDLVKTLNTNFNQFNIFFKYRNFEIINDDYYSYIEDIDAFNTFCNAKDPQNINIKVLIYNNQIFYPSTTPLSNVPITYSDFLKNRAVIIPIMFFDNSIGEYTALRKNFMLHRMGDLLGLWHTESGVGAQDPYFSNNNFYGLPENVTRDKLNDPTNYNADSKGDFVEDTPAETFLSYAIAAIDTNCNYVSNNTTFYDDATPPVLYPNVVPANVMQSAYEYYYGSQCSNIFTAGQGKRMREIIVNSPSQYYGAMPLGNALTFVADLYQPYAKDLVIATNMPPLIYDHGGTATVCRYFHYDNYKFQKGFDYLFPDAEAPDLLSATTDQLPLVVNPMFNYPVTILQLAAGQTNLATNTGYVLNTCKSLICNEEPYTTGTKSFQSQILSTDVTTEMLSSVEINDPNFYINLENQKLYKIIKETQTGAKKEEIFFKQ